jgi:hypothetical protein
LTLLFLSCTHLRADVPHAAGNDFEGRAVLPPQQVEFIHDEQRNVLHVAPLLPAPTEHVPVLGGADNDVALLQKLQIC